MPETLPQQRVLVSRYARRGKHFLEPLSKQVSLDMVLIPGGSYLMGSPANELDNYPDEQPQHPVTVPSFCMGRYPVTQAQWRVVAGYPQIASALDPTPSRFKGAQRPVESVSWDDATEFCQRLSAWTGRVYRLPSEAEWEYACRAGTTTPFHFGETISDELVNYCAQDREINGTLYKGQYGKGLIGEYRQQTTEVGLFPANDFGLHDLHGNVWEWCQDHWHGNYEGAPCDGSAWVEDDNDNLSRRLLRGGSWGSSPGSCRSACRRGNSRDDRSYVVGFRVCCELPRILSP